MKKHLYIDIFENYDHYYLIYENNDYRINFITEEFSATTPIARYDSRNKELLHKFLDLSADDKNEFHNYMEKKHNIKISLMY